MSQDKTAVPGLDNLFPVDNKKVECIPNLCQLK